MTDTTHARPGSQVGARDITARVLAVAGTVAVGFPLAAPLVLALVLAIASGQPLVDFLMPGELFLVVLAGAAALIATALLLRRWRVWAFALTGAAMLLFAAVTATAAATGLATGAAPSEGWRLTLVLVVYGGYVLSVVALFVLGILLCRSAFAGPRPR